MTTKERLHRLVDALADEQAQRALALLEPLLDQPGTQQRRTVVPASLGVGDSGRGDISQRVDELLADGFGR